MSVREELQHIVDIVPVLRADIVSDVHRAEGAPMTGKVLGELVGNIYAAIDAVAGMVEVLARHALEPFEADDRQVEAERVFNEHEAFG